MYLPKLNEAYYAINDIGEIITSTWYGDKGDFYRLKTGNIFETYQDAQKQALDNWNKKIDL